MINIFNFNITPGIWKKIKQNYKLERASLLVYGPPNSGKTKNAKKIAKHFGFEIIIDEFDGGKIRPFGVLYLSQSENFDIPKQPIENILKAITVS